MSRRKICPPHPRNRRHAPGLRKAGGNPSLSTTAARTDVRQSFPEVRPFPSAGSHISQNSGQSAAMYYGMQEARGEFIILMDADLQNDPNGCAQDVPQAGGGAARPGDGACAWHRNDNFIRRLSSTIANAVRGDCCRTIHATPVARSKSCVVRRPNGVARLERMHRFIPALVLSRLQNREMPVEHARASPGQQGRRRQAGVARHVDLLGCSGFSRRQLRAGCRERISHKRAQRKHKEGAT